MKLRATIDLDIDLKGTNISDIKSNIEYAIKHLFAEGLFTTDTSAEIDEWTFDVGTNYDGGDLVEKCMAADTEIWDKLGIVCGRSGRASDKTVANSWMEYKTEVEKWLKENELDDLAAEILEDLIDELTAQNYHSFVSVLIEEEY